jgi:hypothetical protein
MDKNDCVYILTNLKFHWQIIHPSCIRQMYILHGKCLTHAPHHHCKQSLHLLHKLQNSAFSEIKNKNNIYARHYRPVENSQSYIYTFCSFKKQCHQWLADCWFHNTQRDMSCIFSLTTAELKVEWGNDVWLPLKKCGDRSTNENNSIVLVGSVLLIV